MDITLRTTVERAEHGVIDADLGGGLIKQRVARSGQGLSRGFRMLIAYRKAERVVFLYGFAKNNRSDITEDGLHALRLIGANWLAASDEILERALNEDDLQEISNDHTTRRPAGR